MSKFLDKMSDYFAHRKGLLPLIGILLIIVNLILNLFFPADYWIVDTNILLHIGNIVAIFGLMLAWAL